MHPLKQQIQHNKTGKRNHNYIKQTTKQQQYEPKTHKINGTTTTTKPTTSKKLNQQKEKTTQTH